MDWICLESMTKHKAGAIAAVLAKCTQMSESSSWPMPSSFRWEPRGSARKCIFLFIEGEMRHVAVMKWDILGCGRCLTEAPGFFALALVCVSFPWQQCTAVPALAPLNSFLPSALLLLFASPVAQRLQPFSGTYHHFPITLCQVQFPFFDFIQKKRIHLLPSDINVTADMSSPGSQAILWVEQFINWNWTCNTSESLMHVPGNNNNNLLMV